MEVFIHSTEESMHVSYTWPREALEGDGNSFSVLSIQYLTSPLRDITEVTISIKTGGGFVADVGFSFDITDYLLQHN